MDTKWNMLDSVSHPVEPEVSHDCDKCRFIEYYKWERWCMNPDSKHFDEKVEYGFCCKNFQDKKYENNKTGRW